MKRASIFGRARGTTIAVATIACVAITSSCTENLPIGPDSFAAQVQIVAPHDTIVAGDSSSVSANATDGAGHRILSLRFGWTSADSTIVGFAATSADSDAVNGRTRILIGRRPGRAVVSVALPDLRFVVPTETRATTVVVGGIKVLSSHDTSLTAVNDTGFAIATSLVRSNGALVNRASQGLHWTHLGQHTTVVGTGDTIRYIAKSNGPDTLIAVHDFCLVSARCADTVVARVAQLLTLTVSTRTFSAWSFGDSLGPTVTLSDRRGSGLPGASVRLVPVAAADSVIVKVSAPIGVSDPVTGVLAAPRLISSGNGTAHVRVLALLPDGVSVVAVDSVTETVRQVARHLGVEPLRVVLTANDSVAIKPVARDARGAAIPDATITLTAAGVPITGQAWVGPAAGITNTTTGSITPALTGVSLPDSNPAAPQVAVTVDPAVVTLLKPDTVVAAATATARIVTATVFDTLGQPAVDKWIRFGTTFGTVPDSVQLDATGSATTGWTPPRPDSAATYTLVGVRGTSLPMLTAADSAGRVFVLRSVVVKAGLPSAMKTTVQINPNPIAANGTATVTVTVRDQFNNKVKTATGTDFAAAASAGSALGAGAFTCTLGVCTATYTPAGPGTVTITVKIGGVDVLLSPITLTIN